MTATATGRLSSTEPNLQNIPAAGELGDEIRKCLIAKDNYSFIDADYSQIELRLLAHLAQDPVMLEAFRNDQDIHSITAQQIFDLPAEEITPELRRRAKAVNFGIVYGMSAFALANDLNIEQSEAKEYIKNYFATYPAIKKYLDGSVRRAKDCTYAETMFKRRRPLPELASKNFALRSFGERVALNMPIQGSAADLIKLAMIKVEQNLAAAGLQAGLVLQIHDELVLCAPDSEVEAAGSILRESMENALELTLPLKVSLAVGKNFYDIK
jgi:DNA polymerase-1